MRLREDYGGFWRRVAAYLLDCFLIFLMACLVGFVAGVFEVMLGMRSPAARHLNILIGMVIGLIYFPLFESSAYQATLGKKALSLRVIDRQGRRISFGRALGRKFAKLLSALPLDFGFLMIGWTQYRQGLHDKIAGTFVIRSDR